MIKKILTIFLCCVAWPLFADSNAVGVGGGSFFDSPTTQSIRHVIKHYNDTLRWGMVKSHPLMFPTAISIFAPVGFGVDFGTMFVVVGGVNRWPGTSDPDGYYYLGAGLGNGDRYLGVQATGLLDSAGVDDPFAKNGTGSLSVFRWLTPSTSVAYGALNMFGWGMFGHWSKSYYGSVTQYFSFFPSGAFPMALTFGMGEGALNSVDDFRVYPNRHRYKAFGSLAVSLMPRVSWIVDETMDIVSTGFSFIPYAPLPFVVNVYATNLAGGQKKAGPVTYGASLSAGFTF